MEIRYEELDYFQFFKTPQGFTTVCWNLHLHPRNFEEDLRNKRKKQNKNKEPAQVSPFGSITLLSGSGSLRGKISLIRSVFKAGEMNDANGRDWMEPHLFNSYLWCRVGRYSKWQRLLEEVTSDPFCLGEVFWLSVETVSYFNWIYLIVHN